MQHSEYLQPICVSMDSRSLNPLGLVAQGRTLLALLVLIVELVVVVFVVAFVELVVEFVELVVVVFVE